MTVNVEGVEPMTVGHQDGHEDAPGRRHRRRLCRARSLANAPLSEDDFFVVPKVVE